MSARLSTAWAKSPSAHPVAARRAARTLCPSRTQGGQFASVNPRSLTGRQNFRRNRPAAAPILSYEVSATFTIRPGARRLTEGPCPLRADKRGGYRNSGSNTRDSVPSISSHGTSNSALVARGTKRQRYGRYKRSNRNLHHRAYPDSNSYSRSIHARWTSRETAETVRCSPTELPWNCFQEWDSNPRQPAYQAK